MNTTMKKAIIIGATSGIGYEVTQLLLKKDWILGIAGRRENILKEIQKQAPDRIKTAAIDICSADAPERLRHLIEAIAGMDIYLHCAGIGHQNMKVDTQIELQTLNTNCVGFTRMITYAFHYFQQHGTGHIAIISSIAGTKGLGCAPAYSASKRFQNTYLDAMEQLSYMHHLKIHFTDIRPGFVATDLLNDGKHYPMLMKPEKVATCIVQALEKKKRLVIIDKRYQLLVFLWRLIPACLWKRLPIKN